MARSETKADLLRSLGAEPVAVSLFDRAALATAFEGNDAVINLATALPSTADAAKLSAWQDNFRVRSEGSAAVADAALAAGVPRLLQESVVMIYRGRGAEWIDEDWPTDDFPMARSNLAAEASAQRFTAGGRTGVVLRFGWFYGPGARHSEEFFALAKRWGIAIAIAMGAPQSFVSSIHVEDGGRAVAAALDAPAGIFNVADDEPLTKREYAGAIAEAAGRKRFVRAPGRLALLQGKNTTALTRSLRASNARFKAATGWSPNFSSAREGWRATAAVLGR